jgi:Ca2+-binding RTX toxin-like protein
MRTPTIAALTLVTALGLAAEARAATSVSTLNGTLLVNAAPQRTNSITLFDSGTNVIVRDLNDVIASSAPCVWIDSHTTSCPRAAVGHADVYANDLDDTVNQFSSLYSTLSGGDGNDTLRGGSNTDELIGGRGADFMHGAGGTDIVDYGSHPAGVYVSLDGATGDGSVNEGDNVMPDVEWIYGSRFNDLLVGDADPNRLMGDRGDDRLFGMDGDDSVYSSNPNDGADEFNGGTGVDSMSYNRQAINPVRVSLNGADDDGAVGEGDDIRLDVERVRGGKGDDILVGNPLANFLDGYGGRDLIAGRGGGDTLLGGAHDDRIEAMDGLGISDQVDGLTGVDTCISNPIDTEANCEL